VSDVLAATLALVLVLTLLGNDQVGLATLAGMPLVVVLFKIAGLYDRDQLRLVHSTLDEAPLLVQLTGLYALSVTILQPFLLAEASVAVRSPLCGSPASWPSWVAAWWLDGWPVARRRESAVWSSARRSGPSASARSSRQPRPCDRGGHAPAR
jgi:hypothetical protein